MCSPQDDPKYQHGLPATPDQVSADVIISSDTCKDERLPPGQSRTRKWPVLHASTVPVVTQENWSLTISGCVETSLTLDYNQFQKLPRVKVFADFHCVTKWSRLGNLWEGVSTRTIADLAGLQTDARYVLPLAYDGDWSTNLPLEEFLAEDALLCDCHDQMPLSADHGGPVRLIIPRLYAWKSAKWLKGLVFSKVDQPGYWEQAGYHALGDPWREQRFSGDMPATYYD